MGFIQIVIFLRSNLFVNYGSVEPTIDLQEKLKIFIFFSKGFFKKILIIF
jgi:hypothetical protein